MHVRMSLNVKRCDVTDKRTVTPSSVAHVFT